MQKCEGQGAPANFSQLSAFDGADGHAILVRNHCSLCSLLMADRSHVRVKFVLIGYVHSFAYLLMDNMNDCIKVNRHGLM